MTATPTYRKASDVSVRTIVLDVTPGDYRIFSNRTGTTREFTPTGATVSVYPNETRVKVWGKVIKKDGTPGLVSADSEWSTHRYAGRRLQLSDAPSWVQSLAAEAVAE